jgi:chemotaxis family two-component system response regulator Rcp1
MDTAPSTSPIHVLLVEDNPGDVRLTREALRDDKVMIGSTFSVVDDGVEAMAFLRRQGAYAGAARPDVILLDLTLPRKDGFEVLKEVKADSDLSSIPVVVLTNSVEEREIARAQAMEAHCCVVRPVGMDQFATIVRSIEEFWFTIVRLPADEPGHRTPDAAIRTPPDPPRPQANDTGS